MQVLSELLADLERHELWSSPSSIGRGEFLVREGAINQHLYFVDSGCVRVHTLEGDEEHTIRFGYKGSIMAALDSFLTGKPTEYNIEAIRKSTLRYIPKIKLEEYINSNTATLKKWQEMLSHFVVQQMEREKDILITNPRTRYERVLNRSPHLFQEVPLKYIAAYLRMTPETLSRLRKS